MNSNNLCDVRENGALKWTELNKWLWYYDMWMDTVDDLFYSEDGYAYKY